jgi:HK97 family phage portal protein
MAIKQYGRTLFPDGFSAEERADNRPRPGDWDDFWYSRQPFESSTGVDVNEDNSLTYFAVWACRKIICEDIGSIPLHIYRRQGESRIKATEHSLYRLLHDQPNDEMSAMQLRETLQGHALSFGNGYGQIVRSLRGDPLAIWPLNAGSMDVVRDENNQLVYKYRLTNTGELINFLPRDIFHLAGWGFNGIVGYSPIKYWADTIGIGMAEQQFRGTTFKNGAFPTIALSHPAPRGPDQPGRDTFRRKLNEEIAGRGNVGKILTLWEGMTAQKLGMSVEETEIIEAAKLTWVQICAIHRVPPHKVMNLYHATFSNIENQDIDYSKSTIRPWAVRWEQAINRQLLDGSREYYAEHNLDGIQRGDLLTRYQAYAIGRQWGWLTTNNILEKENMNPVEGGDTRLEPLNMVAIDKDGNRIYQVEPVSPDAPVTEDETKRAALVLRHLKLIKG